MEPKMFDELISDVDGSELDCEAYCLNPICACAGGPDVVQIVLLPGEAEYIKVRTGITVPGGKWLVGGDEHPCPYLTEEDTKCYLGYWRPIKCRSAPLQVLFTPRSPLFGISENCSRCKELSLEFILTRMDMWSRVWENTHRIWQEEYNDAL